MKNIFFLTVRIPEINRLLDGNFANSLCSLIVLRNLFLGHLRSMFNRLRHKWKVSWLQFTLIFITFAVGGSLCGYTGRKLLSLFLVDNPWLRTGLYIVIVTLLWPLAVLAVSIPLGQFSFFKNYISKLFRHLTSRKHPKQQK